MDVYQILMQDHRTVEQMFIEIEQTDDREVERREQLFGKLRVALEAHTVVEENLFYPEIDKYPAIKEMVAEAFDEHADFEHTLQQISELPTDKPDWLGMIKELEEVVQEHVHKEEDKMFPAARKELDESRAEELGRQILEMKQEKSPDRALASTRTMMKALVYHGPGQEAARRAADARNRRADRRHRQDHQDDDLRHRPAHPQGRRPELRARAASSAMRASASSSRSGRRSPRSKPAITC